MKKKIQPKPTKTEEEIDSILKDLLSRLKVSATISVIKEEPETYKVNIQTEESGLLIGYHGETINSLQLILGIMLYKKLGFWVRVVLDVGNKKSVDMSFS